MTIEKPEYAEMLIYLSRAPMLRNMRPEFAYWEFQSLDASNCLPMGGARSVEVSYNSSYLDAGYASRSYLD